MRAEEFGGKLPDSFRSKISEMKGRMCEGVGLGRRRGESLKRRDRGLALSEGRSSDALTREKQKRAERDVVSIATQDAIPFHMQMEKTQASVCFFFYFARDARSARTLKW